MKKISVREYLHAINIMGDDVDVYVDGIEGCAVCPPVKFTKAGFKHYKDVLDNPDLHMSDNCIVSDNEDDYDDERLGALDKAFRLIRSLAGYCECSEFKKFFNDGTEEEI